MRSVGPVMTAFASAVGAVLSVFGCSPHFNSDNPVILPKYPRSPHHTTVLHMRGKFLLLFTIAVFPAVVVAQTKSVAVKAVTTPKEQFGFDMGEDYCLANYKQMESYWKKIEGQTDRMKVVSIGKT